jgi:hypothetical protein
MLQADAAACAEAPGEERAEFIGAAVGVVRAKGAAEVPIRREATHHRFGIASGQPVLVAGDDITGVGLAGLEDGRPEVAPLIDRPLAAVGAEHYRQVVGRFGDHRHRPRQHPPVVIQVGQQFNHGPAAGTCRGHGLGAGVQAGQPGQVAADEPPQLAHSALPAGCRLCPPAASLPHIRPDESPTSAGRAAAPACWPPTPLCGTSTPPAPPNARNH